MACGSQCVHTFLKAVNSLSLDVKVVGGVEAKDQEADWFPFLLLTSHVALGKLSSIVKRQIVI